MFGLLGRAPAATAVAAARQAESAYIRMDSIWPARRARAAGGAACSRRACSHIYIYRIPYACVQHVYSPGCQLRSALYNWLAKIEHWPADSKGFFTGERSVVHNMAVFSYINLTYVNRPANAQFWSANCKVHS